MTRLVAPGTVFRNSSIKFLFIVKNRPFRGDFLCCFIRDKITFQRNFQQVKNVGFHTVLFVFLKKLYKYIKKVNFCLSKYFIYLKYI